MSESQIKKRAINERQLIGNSRVKNCSRKDLLKHLNCGNSTLSRILRNEDQLRKMKMPPLKKKRIRSGNHEKVDKAISRWFGMMRERNAYLNGRIVKEKALKIAKALNIHTFKPSNGWLWRWQKKEKIVFKALHEERSIAGYVGRPVEKPDEIEMETVLEGITPEDDKPISVDDDSNTNYDSWWQDEVIVDDEQMSAKETENDELHEDGFQIENAKNNAPNKHDAIIALNTLLQYLCVNGLNLRTIDELEQHFMPKSLGNPITEIIIPHDDTEEPSIEHNVTRVNSVDAEETSEVDEKNKRNDENVVDYASRDQYSVYGEHIGHRLRSCKRNDVEIYTAQHNIDNILYALSMGSYNGASARVTRSPNPICQQMPAITMIPSSILEATPIITKRESDYES